MASRKKAEVRPTLEEVKAKPGRYVVASYRGYEIGAVSIPAPDAYEMGLPQGYVPKDLTIVAWEWRVIPNYWLDDGRLASLYQRYTDLVIDRVDTIPSNENLQELPADIDAKLPKDRKQKAWWVATQPYMPEVRTGDPRRASADLIQVHNMDTTDDSPEQVAFLQEEIAPLLQAIKIFEQKLGNRKNLIADIDARLDEIGNMKAFGSKRRR